MTALDCPNPFNLEKHDENNKSLLKRVSVLIKSHAKTFGFDLTVGDKICDKCRLLARNRHGQTVNNRKRTPKVKCENENENVDNSAVAPKMAQSNVSYLMPMSDSDHDDSNDSNEPYSEKYHQQRAINENNTTVDIQFGEYEDSFNSTPKDNTSISNTTNENSNSLHTMATANPISELKIVAVTSLPAEKHNEIMNNDDNAMNATDSIYNHQLKISEIISTASDGNVFGIAKKPNQTSDDSNLLIPAASHQQRQHMPNQPIKKRNLKLKNLKQKIKNSFRFPNMQGLKSDLLSIGINKESTDSDEHSNSKFNFNSKLSRRKDTLQPLQDCEMEFVELSPPKYSQRQAHMTNEQKILSAQLERVKKIKNPNADLIRKVAFLRVCVNYMMTELEGEPFNFGKSITYESLKTKYNSKRIG